MGAIGKMLIRAALLPVFLIFYITLNIIVYFRLSIFDAIKVVFLNMLDVAILELLFHPLLLSWSETAIFLSFPFNHKFDSRFFHQN